MIAIRKNLIVGFGNVRRGYFTAMFSYQTDDFFDRPATAQSGAVPAWLALLPGLLLIAWALVRAF